MSKPYSRRRKPNKRGPYYVAHTCAASFLIGQGTAIHPSAIKPTTLAKLLGVYSGENKHRAMQAIIAWHRSTPGARPADASESLPSAQEFYKSRAWRTARYEALRSSNGRCALCGTPGSETALHVDHIKPRSLFPHLALDAKNLQVLCEDCNLGKSNKDAVDWRENTGLSQADLEISRHLKQFC